MKVMSLKKKFGLFVTAVVMLLGAQKLTAEEGEADPGLYICSAQFKQYETWGRCQPSQGTLPPQPGESVACVSILLGVDNVAFWMI